MSNTDQIRADSQSWFGEVWTQGRTDTIDRLTEKGKHARIKREKVAIRRSGVIFSLLTALIAVMMIRH